MADWTFLTNHAHVLLCISQDAGMRLRDVAQEVGITERAAQRIIAELVADGYLTRQRDGRRNTYQLYPELPLRHALERHHQIGDLIRALGPDDRG
jgi:DNA-binding IclR family transcriptional regulator